MKLKTTTKMKRMGASFFEFLKNLFLSDMSQSKWGRRVMDQIFREGKFESR